MPWFERFIICKIMKRTLIFFFTVLFASSCISPEKDKIDEYIRQAKSQIDDTTTVCITRAKDEIDAAVASCIKNATVSIDTAMKQSIAVVEQQFNKKAEELDGIKGDLIRKSNIASAIALAGVLVGLAGVIMGFVCLSRLKRENFRENVIYSVKDSSRIKDYILRLLDDKKPQSKSQSLSQDDVKRVVHSYLFHHRVLELLAKELSDRIGQQNISSVVAAAPRQDLAQPIGGLELYARDSRTPILSDVSQVHQKGKTIYKLLLANSGSKEAVLDLCIDKDDVVGRLLRFNNEDLEAICDVSRLTDNPEKVIVVKKGKAEKVNGSDWTVVEKIEIQLS